MRSLLALVTAGSLLAQDPAPVPGFGAGMDGQIGVFGDVIPAIDRLLAHPAVRDVLASDDLRWLIGDDLPEPATLRLALNLTRSVIPSRIVYGATAGTVPESARLLDATLAIARHRLGGDLGLGEVLSRLESFLQAPQRLGIEVHIDVPQARVAEQWFDSIARTLTAAGPRMSARIDGDRIIAEVHLGAAARHFGWHPAELEAPSGELARRLAACGELLDARTYPVRITLTDTGLDLRVGIQGQADALAPGALAAPEPGLVYARWNHDLSDVEALYDHWVAALGDDAFVEALSAEIIVRGDELITSILAWPPTGELSVRFDESLTVELLEEWPQPPAPPFVGDLSFPAPAADLLLLDADAEYTLDSFLAAQWEVLGSLLQSAIQSAYETGDFDLAENLSTLYYDELEPFDAFIWGTESAVFQPGTLTVMTRGPPLGQIRIGDQPWDASEVRLPAVALVGIPRDETAGSGFLVTAARVLRQSLGGPPRDAAVQEDLGLGVPTTVFDLSETARFLDGPVRRGGDLVLHGFQHEGRLVLSTSIALSRAVLAAEDRIEAAENTLVLGRTAPAGFTALLPDLEGTLQAIRTPAARQLFDTLGWNAPALEGVLRASRVIGAVGAAFEARWSTMARNGAYLNRLDLRPLR